jgi:hypothetical protein
LSEGFDRVEGLAGLQAVMQLAEHLVEQVSQGGGVAVAVVSASAMVVLSGAGVDVGIGSPNPADGGEAVVFDPAVGPLPHRRAANRTEYDGNEYGALPVEVSSDESTGSRCPPTAVAGEQRP